MVVTVPSITTEGMNDTLLTVGPGTSTVNSSQVDQANAAVAETARARHRTSHPQTSEEPAPTAMWSVVTPWQAASASSASGWRTWSHSGITSFRYTWASRVAGFSTQSAT